MPPPAIGIDLGTTFTAVCYVDNGVATVIQNNAGKEITPSVVHFDDTIVLIGEEALKKRRDLSMRTIVNIKRIIGRKHDDVFVQERVWPFEIIKGSNDRANIRVGAEVYTPEHISGFIINYMKTIAMKVLFEDPVDAVITVPANFTNAQREATRDAGLIAGLNVLQIVNEPTAAAIAFAEKYLQDGSIRRVLVFDLGGGTFDVSIVEIEGRQTKASIIVLATDGLTSLGGTDFDERIFDEALSRFRDMGHRVVNIDWALMETCESAKRALSRRTSARISSMRYGGASFDLSRAKFVQLCEDLFEQTITITDKVINKAKIDEALIDEILLVGGSTRILRIREMLAERFPNKVIRDDIEPELAVAKGAAILAHSLSQQSEGRTTDPTAGLEVVDLLDVASLQLGVRIDGDRNRVLIKKNTRIPYSAYDFFTNSDDNDRILYIEILEGDSLVASENNTLAKLEIDIEPRPAGKNFIKVVLSIDVDGILSVRATDVNTEAEVAVTIRSEKLSNHEIVRMTNQLTTINQGG